MTKTISYYDLNGWLKFLVIMGFINMGLAALGFLYALFEAIYLI